MNDDSDALPAPETEASDGIKWKAPSSSVEARRQIVEALRRDLVGPLPIDVAPDDADLQAERLGQTPSSWYLTGFIGTATLRPSVPRCPSVDFRLCRTVSGQQSGFGAKCPAMSRVETIFSRT